MEYQQHIIDQVKDKLQGRKSIGTALVDTLGISREAAYRRYRLEKEFTLTELLKLKKEFGISIDNLLTKKNDEVLFNHQQLEIANLSIYSYFESIHSAIKVLYNRQTPHITLTVNNTPFFQLFHYPRLLRFKVLIWSKYYLKMPNVQDSSLDDFYFGMDQSKQIEEILLFYNRIPSLEIYDPELLRGFVREILYYYEINELTKEKSLLLLNDCLELITHIKEQAVLGQKFMVGTKPKESNATIEVYYNQVLNASAIFYFKAKSLEGLSVAHNFLMPLTTFQEQYVHESKIVLDQIIRSSQKISASNLKSCNAYFQEIFEMVQLQINQLFFEG